MKTKTILPIAIAAIFMTLAVAPAISATEVRVAWVPNPDDATTAKFDKVELDESAYNKLRADIESFWNWLTEAKPLADFKIDDNEKGVISDYVTIIKGDLQNCPLIVSLTCEEIVAMFLSSGGLTKKCLLSIGWGKSLMPFNKYEWGFSGGTPFIRPLSFLMGFGYTGVVKYRPPLGAMGWDQVGRHLVVVQGLQGLWIDGGSLGYQRFFKSGIEFIIGRGRVITIGNH